MRSLACSVVVSMLLATAADSQPTRRGLAQELELEGRNVIAAVITGDAIIIPTAAPGRLSAYDTSGRRLWTQDSPAQLVGGIVISGDTIASLESQEGWELALYNLKTGRRLRRVPLDIAQGSDPVLIGGSSARWIIAVTARFTPPPLEALAQPFRSFVRVSPDGSADTVIVVPDHGLQIIPPRAYGRSPIRSPFAPTTSSSADTSGAIFISTGDSLWRLSASGTRDIFGVAERGIMNPLDRAAQVDAWMAQRRRNISPSLAPDTLLRRLAGLDTSSARFTLGKVIVARTGALAIVRRDMARLYSRQDSVCVDIIPAGARAVTQTIMIGPHHALLAFDGHRLVTSAVVPAMAGASPSVQRLFVWRVQSDR